MLMIMILTYKMKSNSSNSNSLKNRELSICRKPNLFIIEIRVQCLSKGEEGNLQGNQAQKINQTSTNLLTLFKKVRTRKKGK